MAPVDSQSRQIAIFFMFMRGSVTPDIRGSEIIITYRGLSPDKSRYRTSPVLGLHSSIGDESWFEQVHWLFRCPRTFSTFGSSYKLVGINPSCESAALRTA